MPLAETEDVPHITERNVAFTWIQMLRLNNELARFWSVAEGAPSLAFQGRGSCFDFLFPEAEAGEF